MYKYVKISKFNFFTIIVLSLQSVCSESNKVEKAFFYYQFYWQERKSQIKAEKLQTFFKMKK